MSEFVDGVTESCGLTLVEVDTAMPSDTAIAHPPSSPVARQPAPTTDSPAIGDRSAGDDSAPTTLDAVQSGLWGLWSSVKSGAASGVAQGLVQKARTAVVAQTEKTWHDIHEKGLSATVSESAHAAVHAGASADQALLGGSLSRFVSSTVERTKTVVNTVKGSVGLGVGNDGGNDDDDAGFAVVLTSTAFAKVQGVTAALQQTFGGAARLRAVPCESGVAAQPVGFAAGRAGAEGRAAHLHASGSRQPGEVVLSVESFVVETSPGAWFDIAHVMLQDDLNDITLHGLSQAVSVPAAAVAGARAQTPADYAFVDTGFAVTCGAVLAQLHGQPVDPQDWHAALTGVSRARLLHIAFVVRVVGPQLSLH